MQINWAPEHSDALREYLAKGMSFSEVADAINAQIQHGLFPQCRDRPRQADGARRPRPAEAAVEVAATPSRRPAQKSRERRPTELGSCVLAGPVFERAEPVKLRCVEIEPRHLSLIELEPAIAGIPTAATTRARPSPSAVIRGARVRATASAHFHLTRGPGTAVGTGGRPGQPCG